MNNLNNYINQPVDNNNMEGPKVSVIVPVYNAGERLLKCIKSIQEQTLNDLEIICVLDCPTDGSDKVIEELANNDSRIKVIHNSHNLNIGESRNVGISIATGEYLAFCDHDDIVMPYMYEEMYTKGLESNADIVLGVPEYAYPDSSLNKTYFYPCGGDLRELLLSFVIGRKKGDPDIWGFYFSHGVIWDNIYRRDMVVGNNIRFIDNNLMTFEDNLFTIECLIKANMAVVYNKKVYIHTIEASNTAASIGYRKPERVINYISYLYDILEKENMLSKYKQNYANSSSRYIISLITRTFLANKDLKQVRNVISLIDECLYKKMIFENADLMTLLKDSKTPLKKISYFLLFLYLKNNCSSKWKKENIK